jgi:hypothetical protein
MREVRRAADDPDFLLKALSEGSGELLRVVMGADARMHARKGRDPDDLWCLHGIAYHMLTVERGVHTQVELIIRRNEPRLAHVDLDDIPFEEDYVNTDIELLLEEFHYQRRRTAYLLWDLMSYDWRRTGIHPYRGPMTVLQLVRELYQHDLEHLWQAQRMVGALQGARR